jgi:hypothetical protein
VLAAAAVVEASRLRPARAHLYALHCEACLLHVELLVVQGLPLVLIHAFLPQDLQQRVKTGCQALLTTGRRQQRYACKYVQASCLQ